MNATLADVLPNALTYLQDLLSARLTPHPAPPAPLVALGLMNEDGTLTRKGDKLITLVYPISSLLDVAVA